MPLKGLIKQVLIVQSGFCISCGKYLGKNKVPLCDAVNGMKFPNKPAFFDLNELEYRVLAPRLVFQKLMQAP